MSKASFKPEPAMQFTNNAELENYSTHIMSPLGLVLTDLTGIFISVNLPFAKMLGYKPEELAGLSIKDVTCQESYAESFDAISEVLKTGGPISIEKSYLHKDGSSVSGITHINAMFNEDHTAGYMCTIVEDLSTINEILKELKD